MALEAENITFSYNGHSPWILENLNLRIQRGERLALAAPSGFGKTTLALLLAGYLHPQAGRILYNGAPLPPKGICPVQLIFQHPEKAVNPRWRLRRVLEEAGGIRKDILDAFGIEPKWLNRFPRELSGGELQRFCAARALAASPQYLICDEISAMLDGITQSQIWDVLLRESARRNMGLIIITHNPHLARKTADRIVDLPDPDKIRSEL